MKSRDTSLFKTAVNKAVSLIYEMGGRGTVENGVVFYKIKKTEELLNKLVVNDYLLHGSTRKIYENLEPYQANDKTKESGNRKAVYITKVPVVAMFCAITGGVSDLERKHESHTTIDGDVINYENMYFGVNNLQKINDVGYVYLLAKSQVDEELNGEFLAYSSISPVAVIEFKRKDFPFIIEKYKTKND